jgi:glutathione synthase/RimK-type ligase-like ATP-grasp enzyme
MHKLFESLNINCPKTLIVSSASFDYSLIEKEFPYPFLLKEPFSNHSRGIYMIKDRNDLISISTNSFKNVSSFLIQQIVNMTKDSRVVVVGDRVVYSYWRTKEKSETFKTTSTSNGAILDFTPLSDRNNSILIKYTKDLGLSTAAFDVTFNDDDEMGDPIVLEVSSSFLINPIPFGVFLNLPYLKFKNKPILFGRERAKAALNFKFLIFKEFYK